LVFTDSAPRGETIALAARGFPEKILRENIFHPLYPPPVPCSLTTFANAPFASCNVNPLFRGVPVPQTKANHQKCCSRIYKGFGVRANPSENLRHAARYRVSHQKLKKVDFERKRNALENFGNFSENSAVSDNVGLHFPLWRFSQPLP
jgi:hypothetical protein